MLATAASALAREPSACFRAWHRRRRYAHGRRSLAAASPAVRRSVRRHDRPRTCTMAIEHRAVGAAALPGHLGAGWRGPARSPRRTRGSRSTLAYGPCALVAHRRCNGQRIERDFGLLFVHAAGAVLVGDLAARVATTVDGVGMRHSSGEQPQQGASMGAAARASIVHVRSSRRRRTCCDTQRARAIASSRTAACECAVRPRTMAPAASVRPARARACAG